MRVLILGYTSIVQRRVWPAMAQCVAITAVDIASRSKTIPEGLPKAGSVFSDYIDALARTDAELVYISLPNAQHAQLVRASLAAGKHVLVDKPATLTLAETVQCLEEARQRSLLLAEATVFSYHPHMDALRDFSGEIGPLTHINARLIIPPMPADNFRNNRDMGGGCLMDMGPYAAAIARLFSRAPLASLDACPAPASKTLNVDLGFSILARFEDGLRFTGDFSFESEYQNRLELVGINGSVAVDRVFSLPADFSPVWHIRQKNKARDETQPPADSFRHFLDAAATAIAAHQLGIFADDMLEDARFRETISNSLSLWNSK